MHAPTEITPALQAVVSARPNTKELTGLGCLVIVARHHGIHLTVSQLIRDNVLTATKSPRHKSSTAHDRSGSKPKRCNSIGMVLPI